MFARCLICVLLIALAANADEPKPPDLTPEERKLAAEATKLMDSAAYEVFLKDEAAHGSH